VRGFERRRGNRDVRSCDLIWRGNKCKKRSSWRRRSKKSRLKGQVKRRRRRRRRVLFDCL
jgi:hypothetical protein